MLDQLITFEIYTSVVAWIILIGLFIWGYYPTKKDWVMVVILAIGHIMLTLMAIIVLSALFTAIVLHDSEEEDKWKQEMKLKQILTNG